MGKGDQRTRRGKIWRGTFGKRRPKKSKGVVKTAPKTVAPANDVPASKARRKESEASTRKSQKADELPASG